MKKKTVRTRFLLTCLLAVLGLNTACGQQYFENTDVQGFAELIADTSVVVLDVRTAAEYAEGHIQGAILIDQGQSDFVEKAKTTLPIDRTIAIYCRSGRRSANAAGRLAEVGYKCVNLKGGIMAWQGSNMPVTSITMMAQNIKGFVNNQMQTYPKSRLLDIYKSCFQDYMGAEHLVSDRARVKAYLDEELSSTSIESLMPWYYEPCGIDSNYYRVSIRTVKEGIVTEDILLDAFIRSARSTSGRLQPTGRKNAKNRPSVESWRERWQKIIGTIDDMRLNLPHYGRDKQFIDSILSAGKYAISHSPDYREAYRPHYRIVERSIFEREIKPLIEKISIHFNN